MITPKYIAASFIFSSGWHAERIEPSEFMEIIYTGENPYQAGTKGTGSLSFLRKSAQVMTVSIRNYTNQSHTRLAELKWIVQSFLLIPDAKRQFPRFGYYEKIYSLSSAHSIRSAFQPLEPTVLS